MILAIFIWAVGILAVFFVGIMISDCNRFVIREYTCKAKGLKKDVTYILLSDLHNKEFGKDNKALINVIDDCNPDGILVAGDMFTADRNTDHEVPVRLLAKLAESYPVYYANGNHEYRAKEYPDECGIVYADYVKELNKAGVNPLVNQKVSLPALGINIYGLEIDRKFYRKFVDLPMEIQYLNQLLGEPDKSRLTILIAHNPEYFKAYAQWGADITVSGHVHGGLMRLPFLGGVISPRLKLFPKYDGGRFAEGNATMLLSRGLGTHTLPVRIFNPGELIVIHLKTYK